MTATTIPLTCDGFANTLADYLERDDSPRVRAAVEAHAARCSECGALLAELQQLRIDASGLPTLTPSRDLWAGIADRIATPVVALDEVRGARSDAPAFSGYPRGEPRQVKRVPVWLRPAAAAAALVVLTAGVTYFATREALLSDTEIAAQPVDSAALDPQRIVAAEFDSAQRAESIETRVGPADPRHPSGSRAPRTSRPVAGSDRAPASVVSNPTPIAAALETVYGREIARLWRIVDERRAQLDTATVGVLERNLNVIDQAIRESRAALARDPASAFLNEQLSNVLEQKVELLRAAALLPARS